MGTFHCFHRRNVYLSSEEDASHHNIHVYHHYGHVTRIFSYDTMFISTDSCLTRPPHFLLYCSFAVKLRWEVQTVQLFIIEGTKKIHFLYLCDFLQSLYFSPTYKNKESFKILLKLFPQRVTISLIPIKHGNL